MQRLESKILTTVPKVRVGSTYWTTVSGATVTSGNFRKSKLLHAEAVWNGATYANGRLLKNKLMRATATWSGATNAVGRLLNNKLLRVAAVWNGATYANGNFLKNKKLTAETIYTGVTVGEANWPKHKKLSFEAEWTGATVAVANILKQKILSATTSYSGLFYAGAATSNSGVGSIPWTNPTNAEGPPDGSYAEAPLTPVNTPSEYLLLQGFGFSIPMGATIDGVELTIYQSRQGGGSCNDNSIRLWLASGVAGNDYATATIWPNTVAPVVYGGPTDLWGLSLTPSDVNDAAFGCAISAADNSIVGSNPSVDAASLKVYFH